MLAGTVDPAVFRGRTVVVGATAASLQDRHSTPVSSRPMSGPELQANAIWTVAHGVPLREAPAVLDVLLTALMALLTPLLIVRLRLLRALAGAVVLGLAYLVVAQVLFERGTVVWAVAPMVALAVGTVTALVASHLLESLARRRIAHDNDVLEARVRARTAELEEAQLEVLRRLALAAEWRDEDTGTHVHRIGILSHELALELGLSRAEAERLRHASTAHDIGKVAIPDPILLKPGPLEPEERAAMERHAAIGAAMLAGSAVPLLQLAETIARTHHERWDGTGYPAGLAGTDIPLPGRICAVVDVFDALVSPRPYKDAWPVEEALAELSAQAGRHFDPEVVAAFERLALRLHAELYPAPADAVARRRRRRARLSASGAAGDPRLSAAACRAAGPAA